MPGRSVHVPVAMGVAALTAFIATMGMDSSRRWTVGLAATAAGGFAGLLPDMLEPAFTPNHRQFFHSLTFGVALGSLQVTKIRGWVVDHRAKADAYWTASQSSLVTVGEATRLRNLATAHDAMIGFSIGLLVGYASHLALDAGTPRGLPAI